MKKLRLAIIGMGKIGRAIDELADAHGFDVVARIGRGTTPIDARSLSGADVAIEFTSPASAPANVRALIEAGCPVVSGTTGWHSEMDSVATAVRKAGGALMWESNFSVGAHLFFDLVSRAAATAAKAGFDAHLVETHHTAKKDAPSGTARTAAEHARAAGLELPITSVRVGNVPGVHEIILDAPYEQLRIEHVVRDRRVFASGALHAARWIIGKKGVFRMRDMTQSEHTT